MTHRARLYIHVQGKKPSGDLINKTHFCKRIDFNLPQFFGPVCLNFATYVRVRTCLAGAKIDGFPT